MFLEMDLVMYTARKMKFPVKDIFKKCEKIRRKIRTCLHLPKKSLMENFIFCGVVIKNCQELQANKCISSKTYITEERLSIFYFLRKKKNISEYTAYIKTHSWSIFFKNRSSEDSRESSRVSRRCNQFLSSLENSLYFDSITNFLSVNGSKS